METSLTVGLCYEDLTECKCLADQLAFREKNLFKYLQAYKIKSSTRIKS